MVGPYNVGKEIGKGATGTVFVGFDPVKRVNIEHQKMHSFMYLVPMGNMVSS